MRQRISLLIIFFFVSWNHAVYAESCNPISDMSPSLGKNLNQQCTNWCYLFTATDMLTQKLKSLGILKGPDRLHPLSIVAMRALVQDKDPSATRFEGGSPDQAILAVNASAANGENLCTERALKGSEQLRNLLFDQSADLNANRTRQGYAPAGKPSCNLSRNPMTRSIAEACSIEKSAWVALLRESCKVQAPHLEWWNNFRQSLYDSLSRGEKHDSLSKDEMDMGRSVDLALDKGKIAGILIDPKRFTNPNRLLSAQEVACSHEYEKHKDKVNLHWVSVVARENHGGICEYLIRNSKGNDCTRYIHPEKCQNGNIWVSRIDLMKMTANVQFIE